MSTASTVHQSIPAMFTPSRDQARQLCFDAWEKYRSSAPLSALEQIAVDVIASHPEYHCLLEDRQSLEREYSPADGAINPFLHLGLHLAIEEQLSIDQPPGLRAEYERIAAAAGSEHDAKHELLECLGETLWQAQRTGSPPDSTLYLDCLTKKY